MRTSIVLAVLLAVAAGAQPLAVDTALREVRKSIESGHAVEALTALGAIDKAQASKRDQARLWFYTARAHEELGDAQSAMADYERAVDLEPTFGAAMNNLAQLLMARGEAAKAAALLKSAVALDDPHHLLYVDNYAAASERAGDIEGARNAYAEVAAAQPDDVLAQLNAIRLLDDPQRAAAGLDRLARRGEAAAAQSLALDLLQKPFDERGKRALLGVVAGTLARQHIAPQKFDAHPAAARLNALRADPAVGAGVEELLRVVRGETDAAHLVWWHAPPDERFGALIKDLGATCAAADKVKAEAYDRLALDYADGRDPDAFIDLADLFFEQKRVKDLDALARQYERPLFQAKAATIAAGDYAAEYRFHVALGTMYSYLGRLGDENDPTSAIFQLTQAQRAAADYNRELKWGQKITLDPKVIELLADAYAKNNQIARAVALRIDGAAAYAAEGRKTAANVLLAPFKAAPSLIADATYRQRYEQVKVQLTKPMTIDITLNFPDSTDVRLTSVGEGGLKDLLSVKAIVNALADWVTGETDDIRDRAEDKLYQLGITRLTPATMSRATGEFEVAVGGKTLKYRYAVTAK